MNFFSQLIRRVHSFSYQRKILPAQLVESLAYGLLSRDGIEGMIRFKQRLETVAPHFLRVWNDRALRQDRHALTATIRGLLQTLDVNIVDREYPAYRDGGIFKNSFSPVRMLISLADLCTNKVHQWKFLKVITLAEQNNLHFQIAFARTLLVAKQYRAAADVALIARRIDSMDYCCARIVNDTQRALLTQGLKPDLPFTCLDNSERFCAVPFVERKYSLSYAGRSHYAPTACWSVAWLPMAFEIDPSWNSEDLQELRKSILDGSFRYCDEFRCVRIQSGLPKKADIKDNYLRMIIDGNLTELPNGPQHLVFCYDMSCNLTCPSCRDKAIIYDEETVNALNAKMDVELAQYMPSVKRITISQAGEALASKHSMHILQSLTPELYPDLTVELFTNLSLVSPTTWKKLGPSAQCIKELFMSIDGATPATLEKLRRGLKWPRMLDALDFVRTLRVSGQLKKTMISFLLQKDNFQELQELIELASCYCVDEVMITTIVTPGSYSSEEFSTINICDPANPLFTEGQKAVEELKHVHEEMLRNKMAIEASGRTVPEIMWRLY